MNRCKENQKYKKCYKMHRACCCHSNDNIGIVPYCNKVLLNVSIVFAIAMATIPNMALYHVADNAYISITGLNVELFFGFGRCR